MLEFSRDVTGVRLSLMRRVAVHGEAPQPAEYAYDLPTNPDELRRGRWDGSLELKAKNSSIFGCSIQQAMNLQKVLFLTQLACEMVDLNVTYTCLCVHLCRSDSPTPRFLLWSLH